MRKSVILGMLILPLIAILLFIGIAAVHWADSADVVPKCRYDDLGDMQSGGDNPLILVNFEHPVPKNYEPELVVLDNGKSVESCIYPSLQEMFDDMRGVGVYPTVSEGYRSAEEQSRMMTDYIDRYIGEGYSKREAKELAEKYVAKVGYSEHQLGLAVDINADTAYCSDEDVYAWLAENAWSYGFILRYPADKTDLTGIEFEPWHYRYVGFDAAREIFSKGICLEEYKII